MGHLENQLTDLLNQLLLLELPKFQVGFRSNSIDIRLENSCHESKQSEHFNLRSYKRASRAALTTWVLGTESIVLSIAASMLRNIPWAVSSIA